MKFAARRYDTGLPVSLELADGHIAACTNMERAPGDALPWVAPGFVDLQVNGYGGKDFSRAELNVEEVDTISRAMDAFGCTKYCPTVTTNGVNVLLHAMATLRRACEENKDVARRVAGIHLEGPYLSPHDGPRGAHPREHCRPPDWDEFSKLQDAAGGRIKILTLSPEYDNSAAFIERVSGTGVVVAIGHTAADSSQIKAAVDAGARLSTHLGNGAHGQIRRHPNYIWDQLAEDRLWASLIVDGHHLPAEVVKSFVRAKTPQRCLLVSDITGMAGLPPGEYRGTSLGDIDILADGRLVLAGQTQYLAGASLPMDVNVATVMKFAGVDLKTAIEMATLRPAQLIGLETNHLQPGDAADLVLFDMPDAASPAVPTRLKIRATVSGGEVVYGAA